MAAGGDKVMHLIKGPCVVWTLIQVVYCLKSTVSGSLYMLLVGGFLLNLPVLHKATGHQMTSTGPFTRTGILTGIRILPHRV